MIWVNAVSSIMYQSNCGKKCFAKNICNIISFITKRRIEVTTNNSNLPKATPEWLEMVGCVNGKKNTSS